MGHHSVPLLERNIKIFQFLVYYASFSVLFNKVLQIDLVVTSRDAFYDL